jgi:hypothetical protein
MTTLLEQTFTAATKRYPDQTITLVDAITAVL